MTDLIALITIIAWPIIPLFWIPLHLLPHFYRKIKILTYIVPIAVWLPIAYLIYLNKSLFLQAKIEIPLFLNIAGLILLLLGTLLHIWTGKLLRFRGLIGVPEIYSHAEGRVVREGAFSFVRHPTYLAHTVMFSGVFLMTGVLTVGILTLLDYVTVNLLIIPLEEKELVDRFGRDYEQYKTEVPKFFPRIK